MIIATLREVLVVVLGIIIFLALGLVEGLIETFMEEKRRGKKESDHSAGAGRSKKGRRRWNSGV